ncbi:hypothetical protein PR003_g17288 [Phytophthora rubi]|uniref:Uncharacterized protein n=1 Tax=Phytophthora rubi TaxID=129364 RepID=A0A6A4EPD5_9STRA|nr:hypothetical protein PR002_g16831 [Phytophthora rubi]KAE9024905.1 hypothetical protein PR001_g12559 [Phytophthora rubi]KAE9322235.1 hypothetical protein PR003_g17288 [Phytophthora rubi]
MSAPTSSQRAPVSQSPPQASSASAEGGSLTTRRNSRSGMVPSSDRGGPASNSPLVVDVTANDAPGDGTVSGNDAGGDVPNLRGINNVQPAHHVSAACLGTCQLFVSPFSFRVTVIVICLEVI